MVDTQTVTAEVYGWQIAPSVFNDVWVLRGYVLNDTKGRFKDHDSIRTSYITKIDLENRLVHTLNSVYKILFNHEVPDEKFD